MNENLSPLAPRLITLIASATEIVCALGLRENLVGRSHECDFPASVGPLPQCSSPKFQTDGSSYQIDERIKAIVQEGLSVYKVHADQLERLQPQLILTQDQCEVCAVSLKDLESAVCETISSQPQILSLNTNSLSELWRDIQRVADFCGVPERGINLIKELRGKMEQTAYQCAIEAAHCGRPRVASIEWIAPLMTAGNWMPELVELAGGSNCFGEAGKHSPWITWEQVRLADPDVLFISPCGFDLAKTEAEAEQMKFWPGWSDLSAVKNQRVFLADGNAYFHRPGPRLVESLEILASLLHPSLRGLFAAHAGEWESFRA